MSRNFENEYKKYAASTAPDLWNRIMDGIDLLESTQDNANINRSESSTAGAEISSSGISPAGSGANESADRDAVKTEKKPEQTSVRKNNKVVDISVSERYTNFEQDAPKSKGNKTISINTFMSRYGGAIAATACGVIGLMLASTVMPRGCGSSATSDYSAAPAAPSMEAAPAAVSEAADYAAEETADFDETSPTNADNNDTSGVLTAGRENADTNAANKKLYDSSTKDQEFTAQADTMEESTEYTADESESYDEAEAYEAGEEAPATENVTASKPAKGPSETENETGEDVSAATGETGTQTTEGSASTAAKEEQISTFEIKAAIKSVTGSKGHMFCELIVKDSYDSGLKEGSVIRAKLNEDLEDEVDGVFRSSDGTEEHSINLYFDPQVKMYVLLDIIE